MEKEMQELITAHRALAARTEALFQVSKVMFAIISADHSLKARLLTSVYDITTEHMTQAGLDEQYQEDVRQAVDELARVILAGDI